MIRVCSLLLMALCASLSFNISAMEPRDDESPFNGKVPLPPPPSATTRTNGSAASSSVASTPFHVFERFKGSSASDGAHLRRSSTGSVSASVLAVARGSYGATSREIKDDGAHVPPLPTRYTPHDDSDDDSYEEGEAPLCRGAATPFLGSDFGDSLGETGAQRVIEYMRGRANVDEERLAELGTRLIEGERNQALMEAQLSAMKARLVAQQKAHDEAAKLQRTTIDDLRRDKKSAFSERNQLKAQVKKQEGALMTAQKAAEDLLLRQAELKSLRQEFQRVKTALDEREKAFQKMQAQSVQQRVDMRTLKKERDDLKRQLQKRDDSPKPLETGESPAGEQLQKMEEEMDALRADLDAYRGSNMLLQREKADLERERSTLLEGQKDAERRVSEEVRKREESERKLQDLGVGYQELEQDYEGLDAEHSALEGKHRALEEENRMLEIKHRALETDLSNLQNQLGDSQQKAAYWYHYSQALLQRLEATQRREQPLRIPPYGMPLPFYGQPHRSPYGVMMQPPSQWHPPHPNAHYTVTPSGMMPPHPQPRRERSHHHNHHSSQQRGVPHAMSPTSVSSAASASASDGSSSPQTRAPQSAVSVSSASMLQLSAVSSETSSPVASTSTLAMSSPPPAA